MAGLKPERGSAMQTGSPRDGQHDDDNEATSCRPTNESKSYQNDLAEPRAGAQVPRSNRAARFAATVSYLHMHELVDSPVMAGMYLRVTRLVSRPGIWLGGHGTANSPGGVVSVRRKPADGSTMTGRARLSAAGMSAGMATPDRTAQESANGNQRVHQLHRRQPGQERLQSLRQRPR